MMMVLYILILCGSAYFASFAGMRVGNRILREMDAPRARAQVAMALSLICFLTIVSAPTGVMTGALLVAIFGVVYPLLPPLGDWRGSVPLLAAAGMGVVGVTGAPGAFPAMVPAVVWWAVSFGVFLAYMLSVRHAAPSLQNFSAVAIVAVIPLGLAPLLFADAHHSLAVDGGLIASALLGGVVASTHAQATSAFLRLPVAMVTAYLALQAVRYGAWPLAGVCVVLWFLGMATMQRQARSVAV